MISTIKSRRGDMMILLATALSAVMVVAGYTVANFQSLNQKQQLRREIELEGFALGELAVAHAYYQTTKSSPVTATGFHSVPFSLNTVSQLNQLSLTANTGDSNAQNAKGTVALLPRQAPSTHFMPNRLQYEIKAGATPTVCGVFTVNTKTKTKLCLVKTSITPPPPPNNPYYTGEDLERLVDAKIQPDGKILLLTQARLLRVNADFTTDTSFDGDGMVIFNQGPGYFETNVLSPHGVAILPTGKIIVGGTWSGITPPPESFNTQTDVALIRLNANGTYDTSFGTQGKVLARKGSKIHHQMLTMEYDAVSDQVTLGGTLYPIPSGTAKYAYFRFRSDGALVAGFGSGGKLEDSSTAIPGTAGMSAYVWDLVFAPNGKMYALLGLKIVRYNVNGSKDNSFGTNGEQSISPNTLDFGQFMARQNDGKIVVSGGIGFKRFNADGGLDNTFGTAGVINDVALGALTVDANGKILAIRRPDINTPNMSSAAFRMRRYNNDGSLDTSFGTAGTASNDFCPWHFCPVPNPLGSHSLLRRSLWDTFPVVKPDGKLLVAGTTQIRELQGGQILSSVQGIHTMWFVNVIKFDENGR